MYKTYKFYLADSRRIAAFAEHTNDSSKLKLTLIYCSTADAFNKAYIRDQYSRFLAGLEVDVHPQVFMIPIDPQKPHQSFIDYMEQNYYRVSHEVIKFERKVLARLSDLDVVKLKGTKMKPFHKMDAGW